MSALDWDAIEKEASEQKRFKDYAENGEHDVKVKSAALKDNGNGWFEFEFEETDTLKYPKLSFAFFGDDKQRFRAHYYKEVMKVLGTSEDNARKAVDVCESKSDRSAVHKAYAVAFSRLASKHPKIKIEVRDQYDRDGNPVMSASGTVYGESVFTQASGLQFKQKRNSEPTKEVVPEDIPDEEIDLSEIPFN